jgi:hypothetical protein
MKRTIRNNLAIEMLHDVTVNFYARFDTMPRFNLLMGYFGSCIQGAGRIRRMAGPKLLRRTGPCPAFTSYRIHKQDTVGAVLKLSDTPTKEYHSKKPGVDICYHPARRQFTVRLRYIVEGVGDEEVRQNLLGIQPPLPAMPNNEEDAANSAVEVVPNFTQFQHQGTLFLVIEISADGEEGVCQVEETTNNNFIVGGQVHFGMNLVKLAVAQYNAMDVNEDDEDDDDDTRTRTDDDDDDDDDNN